MKSRILCCFLLCLAVAAYTGCSRDESPTTPASPVATDQAPPAVIAEQLLASTGWTRDPDAVLPEEWAAEDKSGRCFVEDFGREVVVGNIVHYWWVVSTGPGQHERIGLHRVVKERRPFRPIRARRNLFALHGTPGKFDVMFLFGSVTSAPDDHSLAVYLARRNVDVWGIDQPATLIPADVEDFSFMADWSMQTDVDALRTGMAVARISRLLSGSGFGRMNLLGYSTGLMTGFAALDLETQLPWWARHVGGFIPVDYFYKTQSEEWNAGECANVDFVEDLFSQGIYQADFGILFQTMGMLAQNDPQGDSPIVPGFDNRTAALMAGAVTGAIFGFPGDLHFFGGEFDEETGLPTDLVYTPTDQYFEWLQGFNDYNSYGHDYDISRIHCPDTESPWDDHLDEITVPVFFVGAEGGWGSLMDHTASLLTGSDDVSLLNVSLNPVQALDIGHVDIFTAECAPQEFWRPMLEWIVQHSGRDEPEALASEASVSR
ncbi:hypothetical protein GF314_01210 [bacterium]|nr:hypothetical protein [bacterium]